MAILVCTFAPHPPPALMLPLEDCFLGPLTNFTGFLPVEVGVVNSAW